MSEFKFKKYNVIISRSERILTFDITFSGFILELD